MKDVDVSQLLLVRLWVARLGERDVMGWWQTDGILGADGAFVGPRVLPKTHRTARARIAFAVARHACDERHPDPNVNHIFRLDPETEDRLDAYLVESLDDFDWWTSIVDKLEKIDKTVSPAAVLHDADVATDEDIEYVKALALGPDNRSLPIVPGKTPQETLRRLAAGITRSSPGKLAVPYVQES